MAEKLTELEMKAYNALKEKGQALNEYKFQRGDLETQLDLIKEALQNIRTTCIEKSKEVSTEWEDFLKSVKTQYGEGVQIDTDGNIIKGEGE